MNRKITMDILQKYAKSHGGLCLSENYINPRMPLKWQCVEKHIWIAPWKSMYDGRWCKKCNKESLKVGIRIAKQIATEREGKCLSEIYINGKEKLKWRCQENHTWSACLDNIKNKNQWCPECALNKTRLTIKDCQKAAEKFGGRCLSSKYKNAHSIIELECKYKHIWKTTATSLIHKHKWCPKCRNKSQNILADNIKKIYVNYTIEQNYRKFKWLDTENGGRQEIDIFIPELKLAIEYDGEGHSYQVNFGGCNDKMAKSIFEKTKKLDKLKNKKIKQHSDDIRYFVRFSYMDDIFETESVRQKLEDNNIPIRVQL